MGVIKHIFSNAIADGTNTAIVRPSDWNSSHAYTLQDAVTLGGNTSGVMALISSGALLLAGGSNVTLSQNGNSVTISAASTAPQTAYSFSNANGVSFGTNGSTVTATVATNYQSQGAYLTTAMASNRGTDFVQAAAAFAGTSASGTINSTGISVSIGPYITTARRSTDALGLATAQTNVTWTANSAGVSLNAGGYAGTGFTSTTTAGTAVVGTNNTAGLSLGVPALLTTAALSNHSHGNPQLNLTNLSGTTASNSAGFTLSLSAGTVAPSPVNVSAGTTSGNLASVVFSNSNQVSFGLNGSTITASVEPTSSVVGTSGVTVSTNGNTASFYVTASNVNGISFGFSNGALTGSVQTSYAASNHSHGNPQLNLTNLSGTTASNSAGFTLSLSAAAPGGGAQTAISGIIASDATYTSGSVYFSGQNNITVGSSVNGASQYVRLSVGAYITTAALSQDSSKYAFTGFTTTTVAGAVVAGTHDTLGLKLAVPAYLTTAQAPGAYLTTARASNDAIGLNTALTANGVAWTANSSGLSLNIPAFLTTAALSNHSHGNPQLNLTNLSGTTASNSAGLTLSLSAAAPGAAVESNAVNLLGANTAGNTTATGSTIGFSGVNLTLSGTNNSQIVLSVPATSSLVGVSGLTISTAGSTVSIGYSGIDRNMHEIIDGERLTTACAVTGGSYSKRPILMPFWLDGNSLQPRTVRFLVSKQAAEASLNITMGVGFYSMANTSSLNLAFSTTNAFSLTTSALWSGIRVMDITGFTNATHTLSEGRWVLGLYVSGSNNSTVVMNLNFMGGEPFNNVGFILAGTNSSAATASQSRFFPFWGVFNATTAAYPAAIALSSIAGGASNIQADIYAALLEIGP